MRKSFSLPLMLLMGIVAMAFTACSDNVTTNFVINNGQPEAAINRLGGNVEIPITASGEWTATISGNEQDGLPWCVVRQVKGNGSANLIADVDYFDPRLQRQERKAQVTITNGDKSQVITLRQYIGLKDGETADNEAGIFYPDIWNSKGVGRGFDPVSGDMTTNFVLNISRMIDWAQSQDYKTFFSQENRKGMDIDVILNDTLEKNSEALDVHCQINVKFAKFKLGLEVDYNNSAAVVQNTTTYTGSQDLEYLKSYASSADIAAILEDDWDDDKREWKEGHFMSDSLVSTGFHKAWENVMKYRDDESKFPKAMESLIRAFGPVVVDGATLGGSIFTAIQYDSTSVAEDFKVNGKVTADVALAAIKISGNVDASYAKAGQDIWQNSHFFCSISGGNPDSYGKLMEQMTSTKPDTAALRSAARAWMESICSSSDITEDNTAVINIQYTGIWNLFPFYVADDIKNYIGEYYEKRKKTYYEQYQKDLPLCIDIEGMVKQDQ